ncbi:hypothetical protein [Actinocorallia populi]|uniref:hypothetical protein n=1 Tax=Actinocorallia populi TaxID=2079200 RepID=UPI000D0920B0|nr:hypothetical protein [Actinocorallia populi]
MEDFHALLVVDAEQFSGHRDNDLPDLHLEIRSAVASAFEASGLGEVWQAVRFLESTGDGLLTALPHRVIPTLIDPFPLWLQEALAQAAPRLRARGMRLRLRAAVHVGLLDEERPDAPGISTAVIDVNRLLDAGPLRDALKHSDPDATFTAFLLSEEVFTAYVRGGRTGLRTSRFTEVRVKVKQFDRPAHLYVPVPSRNGTPPEAAPAAPSAAPPGGTSPGGVTVNGDRNQNVFGNQISGGFQMGRP